VGAAEIAAIAAAGMAAGAINTLVGSGTLITFPSGAVLLLVLPASAFEAIVPAFIAIALVAVALQPRLDRLVAAHRPPPDAHGTGLPRVLVYVAGVYGGYFGAAQGILLLAILGLALPDDLQRVNALKNVLAGIVNGVAALVFIVVADVAWGPAALIAAGSVLGAQLAARYGRRLSPQALRAVIVVVGIAAIVQLLT
jgi:uncharacterized membrane protein YfcA